jgi:hypothetical protein
VALHSTEWDGMTDIAHLVFAHRAMRLSPVLALRLQTDQAASAGVSTAV